MSRKRSAAPPPGIPGFRYISLLGSGGFADVYLYEQDRPRRRVAVKVLISDLRTEGARKAFESEANLMAQLSSHPYIVTIFQADVTDDGHSYLAMEYCSRPSLDLRYRKARLSVAEALTVGIQVASAVESAHRAGIVHRDIKPANILVTDYNRPALTDFGISGTTDSAVDEDHGMSIPWSPPEAFRGGGANGISMDVWALGATIYTLLAGRSPFVFPGMDNSQRTLVDRIATMPLQNTGRDDVPQSFELALSTAMTKSPDSRYSSAHAFALALQRIQSECGMSVTPFEVLDDAPYLEDRDDDDEDMTRVRRITSIDPDSTTFAPTFPKANFPDRSAAPARNEPTAQAQPTAENTASRPGSATPIPEDGWSERTVMRGGDAESDSVRLDTTINRPERQDGVEEVSSSERKKRNPALIAAASVAVLAAVVVGVLAVVNGQGEPTPEATTAFAQDPSDPLVGLEGNVPPVEELKGAIQKNGSVLFTWKNPDPRDGDIFRYRTVSVTESGKWVRTDKPRAEVRQSPEGQTCVEVQVTRRDGPASEPAPQCL
ncbi:serine/threonine-protein kinase [Arthrobacter roseus]|uniref:serine/threonine-protein kinase n=1 Tax=Arthrobacter roseus TaxID=136274 RepID=UPI0019634801|nr:serine/threonine-protein kinase [Arthrobacter roseus]MBM7848079.1 serine/threonine protein kinase [Arthrobacter roseus]